MIVRKTRSGTCMQQKGNTVTQTNMRLSEAIRLGDTLIGNDDEFFIGDGRYDKYVDKSRICGCAIGSALYAIGVWREQFKDTIEANNPLVLMKRLRQFFPIISMPIEEGTFDPGFEWSQYFDHWNLFCEISAMHRENPDRERIADFVAKLENEHPEYLCQLQPESESTSEAMPSNSLQRMEK